MAIFARTVIVLSLGVWACACASKPSQLPDGSGPTLGIERLEPSIVLPGTWVRIQGEGFVDANSGSLTVLLERGGGAPWMISPIRDDDEHLRFQVDRDLFTALGGPGVFQGSLSVRADYPGGASQTAETSAIWTLEERLTPSLNHFSPAVGATTVYLGTDIEALGAGFLLAGEGHTELRLNGTFTPQGAGDSLPVVGRLIVLDPQDRDRLTGPLPASAFGIEPGVFSGDLTPVNVHDDDVEVSGAPMTNLTVEMGPTFLSRVEPEAAARGQWIDIYGRGFVSGSATVVIEVDGTFTDELGQVTQLTGQDVLRIVPEVVSGDHMRYVLRVYRDPSGELQGLGLHRGTVRGTVTPVVYYGADEVRGLPLSGELVFEVLPQKQVVFVSYLPGFTDTLRVFGLRNVEGQIRSRIDEVLARDYADFSVEFRSTRPTDYIEYSVIEVGGEDPNGRDLLGLDNSMSENSMKDTGNFYFDDIVGGMNADSRESGNYAFGGVFLASYLLFSPSHPKAMPISSTRFDDIFKPFMPDEGGREVDSGEYPGGARAEQIDLAIHALGSMIGNTITHEIGHTLGLAAGPSDVFHNQPSGPNQIMDAGADRPFEERAEIDGQGPARWTAENRQYLEQWLPR